MLLKTILRKSIAVAVVLPLALAAEDKADLAAIYKIKNEAFQNSKVMDHMFHLTDVHGPRLTGSPGYRAAAEWVVKRLGEYGIGAKLEKWGPFGRGWTYTRYSAHMLEPGYSPLIGFPLAWTGSTNGVVTGEPIHVTLATEADLEKNKGKYPAVNHAVISMTMAREPGKSHERVPWWNSHGTMP